MVKSKGSIWKNCFCIAVGAIALTSPFPLHRSAQPAARAVPGRVWSAAHVCRKTHSGWPQAALRWKRLGMPRAQTEQVPLTPAGFPVAFFIPLTTDGLFSYSVGQFACELYDKGVCLQGQSHSIGSYHVTAWTNQKKKIKIGFSQHLQMPIQGQAMNERRLGLILKHNHK